MADFLTSDYASGSVTIQGLGNGTDFSETIAKLRTIEEIPARRLLKWKADWQERQEAFRIVRQQLVSLREMAASMNSIDKFMVKAVSSSRSDVATATAGSAAQEGVYKLEVNQLATNSIWSIDTGFADLSTKVNTSAAPTNFTYQYGGKTRTLSIAPGTTLDAFKNLINNDAQNPGVRASVIKSADGYTFQLRGMDMGSDHELHITYANLDGFPPSTDYDGYSVGYNTGLTTAAESVNASGKTQEFVINVNGKRNVVSVADGDSLQTLVDNINSGNGTSNFGVTASLSVVDGKQVMTLNPTDPAAGTAITVENKTTAAGEKWLIDALKKPSAPFTPKSDYSAAISTGLDTPLDVVNAGTGAKYFAFTHGGMRNTLAVPAAATLSDFMELINSNTSSTGVSALLSKDAAGKQVLTLSAADGKPVEVVTPLEADGVTPMSASAIDLVGVTTTPVYTAPTSSGWYVQQSQDAKLRVNGWPAGSWLTYGSNTVDEVAEGMTFNLKDTGTSVLTVATDAEKMKENVLSFIDAINTFRSTILELTKLDDSKETVDPKYATSLYDMQKGSILTGNYGVQLLSSQIKQATAGMPLGFVPMKEVEGYLTGDMFTSLSQLGIKTEASGSSGLTFGLLVLNTDPDLPMLDDMLAKNPLAVAEFFAANNKGTSSSSDFSFSSQIQSITVPGSYDVKYTVNSDGSISNATINGKTAKYYPDTGEIGLVHSGPESSDTSKVTATFDGTTSSAYDLEVQQLATAGSVKIDTTLTSGASSINDSGAPLNFTYEHKGNEYSIDVPSDATLFSLVNTINKNSNSGVTAKAVKDPDTGIYSLNLTSKETGAGNDVTIPNNDLPLLAATPVIIGAQNAKYTISTVSSVATSAKANLNTGFTAENAVVTTTEQPLVITVGGNTQTITVPAGQTLRQLVTSINNDPASLVKAGITLDGGTYKLTLENKNTGSGSAPVTVSSSLTNLGGTWTQESGVNAGYTQTQAKESNTNTVTGVVSGMEFTLKGVTDSGKPVSVTSTKYNDADGIMIHPDNLSAGSYTGQVHIKQGKINELLRLLDGPPSKPEEGMLGSKGALQILQDNYDDIIAGIDAKIDREDTRITKWERLLKLRFARLDATLKLYDSLSTSIASQIDSLSSGS